MALSSDLISQFVKTVKNDNEKPAETTVYGTVVVSDGKTYVQIDGSTMLTPFTSTAHVEDQDRVTVMIKNHSAVITGNLSRPSATKTSVDGLSGEVSGMSKTLEEFDIIVADKVSTEQLNAEKARIDDMYVDILKVQKTETGDLTAKSAVIDDLKAAEAEFDSLCADVLDVKFVEVDGQIKAQSGVIGDLKASDAEFRTLKSDYADLKILIFGTATGDVIQTEFANAVIAQLGDAQIKSAMIQDISASKITAGDIITNNVRVMSEDGKLLISDETIQISDETRVRVQIGKDASGDYSINIWDDAGNLMFSEGGITDHAIKNAIIRDDMVSDTANIAAHKIDIDSLFEEINGSSKTIKSTKVYFDDKAQTLDVVFKAMSDDVTSQGTQIEAIQGKIDTKVWQQDIDEVNEELSTQYSELEQTVDGISSTVSNNKTELSERVAVSESIIQQLSNCISMLVTDENGESLMTQTEDGWTFNMKETSEAVSDLMASLETLQNETGDTKATVDTLQQAVNDHGRALEYVNVSTYEGEPCIELGESDSDFKLLITNTRIMFMNGSNVPTYINTNGLVTQNIEVKGEIVQGGYVMMNTADGGWGLLWKGVSS